MVSTPTTLEERKRKSTWERTKVVHLSRQLQLRLQYAKLKVEHGWHKRNLTEVENLYFRRSSFQPRSTLISDQPRPNPPAVATPVSHEPEPTQNSSSSNEDLSAKESSVGKETINPPPPQAQTNHYPQIQSPNSGSTSKSSGPSQPRITSHQPSLSLVDAVRATITGRASEPPRSQHPQFSTVPQLTAPKTAPEPTIPAYPITNYYGALFTGPIPVGPVQKLPSPSQTPATSAPPHPHSHHHSQKMLPAFPTSTTDPFQFTTAATASLTYDSFWISHLATRSRSLSNLPPETTPTLTSQGTAPLQTL